MFRHAQVQKNELYWGKCALTSKIFFERFLTLYKEFKTLKISKAYTPITYNGVRRNNKTKESDKVQFHANPIAKTVSAGVILSLLSTGYVNIVSALKRGKQIMNETDKFIDIREDFSKEAEPAQINSGKAGWEFFINSTPENQKLMLEADDKFYAIYKNEDIYKKLLEVDKSKLPQHEAKQLKDLLRSFDEELNTGEAKKALREKEAEIGQKYNTYVPKIDGKEVTRVDITKITQTETNPDIRKKAYEAKVKGGDLIAEDLIELVKMRNEYAKTKGYDNYFDYMIKEEYDVEPAFLDKLIDDVYSKAQPKIKALQEKRHKELKEFFGVDNLEAYHYGLLLDSDPEKGVNEILINNNVEDLARKTYSGMGYDIDELQKQGKLTLDLYPRKGKNTHGFCFGIEAGKDSRILANLMNNVQSLDTLNHELGHCVYDLGISAKLPYLDKAPASSAVTEAIAMMMGDIMKKENILKGKVPDELLKKFKESLKDDEANFVSRSLQIIEFERELYKNPDQNPAKLWAKMRSKYLNRHEAADNEWATIPHYLTHPGYYQNYFRATLMKAQIYNHLNEELGNITENSKTAEYMNKNIFELGASLDEYELIKKLTGKEFGVDDFAAGL